MGRVSDEVAADRVAAAAGVRRALEAERRAREELERAQGASGAALAVARMAGVTWPALTTECGMSKQSLVERLARWGRGRDGEGTRFALPAVAVRDAPLPEVDDGQGPSPTVWGDEIVQSSVRRGVEWAQLQTRRQFDDGADPVEVLDSVEEAGRTAVLAALAVARSAAAAMDEPPARTVAVEASRAAAATANRE